MSEPFRTGLWKSDRVPGSYSVKLDQENAGRLASLLAGGPVYVDLYKNDRKETDRHPDLNLVVKSAGNGAGRAESGPVGDAETDPFESNDIPF